MVWFKAEEGDAAARGGLSAGMHMVFQKLDSIPGDLNLQSGTIDAYRLFSRNFYFNCHPQRVIQPLAKTG